MIMISPVSDEISLFDVYVCLDDSADLDSPLVWQSGPWSLCSKSCGGGLQFRTVQCVIRFSETNMTKDLPAAICESAKVRKPGERRACGLERCYSWIKSPWSPCAKGDCVSREKGQTSHELSGVDDSLSWLSGLQSRAVHCILDKRSIVEEDQCEETSKPLVSQLCRNTECVGVWVVGEWSQVSPHPHSVVTPHPGIRHLISAICLLKRKFNWVCAFKGSQLSIIIRMNI